MVDCHLMKCQPQCWHWWLQRYVICLLPLDKQCTDLIKLYAALYEWRSGTHRGLEFSASMYLDVYLGHVGTLEHIQDERQHSFHAMMSEIYLRAR